jgi:hypothetical protein
MMRCRTGTVPDTACATVPGLQRTAPQRNQACADCVNLSALLSTARRRRRIPRSPRPAPSFASPTASRCLRNSTASSRAILDLRRHRHGPIYVADSGPSGRTRKPPFPWPNGEIRMSALPPRSLRSRDILPLSLISCVLGHLDPQRYLDTPSIVLGLLSESRTFTDYFVPASLALSHVLLDPHE